MFHQHSSTRDNHIASSSHVHPVFLSSITTNQTRPQRPRRRPAALSWRAPPLSPGRGIAPPEGPGRRPQRRQWKHQISCGNVEILGDSLTDSSQKTTWQHGHLNRRGKWSTQWDGPPNFQTNLASVETVIRGSPGMVLKHLQNSPEHPSSTDASDIQVPSYPHCPIPTQVKSSGPGKRQLLFMFTIHHPNLGISHFLTHIPYIPPKLSINSTNCNRNYQKLTTHPVSIPIWVPCSHSLHLNLVPFHASAWTIGHLPAEAQHSHGLPLSQRGLGTSVRWFAYSTYVDLENSYVAMLLWAILKLMEIFGCLAPRCTKKCLRRWWNLRTRHSCEVSPHRMVNMWFHPPINHGFWGGMAIQLLQVLSSHPLGSGNGGFNPKSVTIFTGKMMMNPGKTCCFRIIFRYRTRHFHFVHFAPSPSALSVPSAAPSQLTHPLGSLERPARSTRAVSAAALNYLPLLRADHSTAFRPSS